MNGLPSVIIGIFVFGLLVYGHTQSGYAGGFALSIVMLPLIARVDPGGAPARAAQPSVRQRSRSASAAGGSWSASSCRARSAGS